VGKGIIKLKLAGIDADDVSLYGMVPAGVK